MELLFSNCYMLTDRYFRNCEPIFCRRVEYTKTAHGFIDLAPLNVNNTAHILLPVEVGDEISEFRFTYVYLFSVTSVT